MSQCHGARHPWSSSGPRRAALSQTTVAMLGKPKCPHRRPRPKSSAVPRLSLPLCRPELLAGPRIAFLWLCSCPATLPSPTELSASCRPSPGPYLPSSAASVRPPSPPEPCWEIREPNFTCCAPWLSVPNQVSRTRSAWQSKHFSKPRHGRPMA